MRGLFRPTPFRIAVVLLANFEFADITSSKVWPKRMYAADGLIAHLEDQHLGKGERKQTLSTHHQIWPGTVQYLENKADGEIRQEAIVPPSRYIAEMEGIWLRYIE